MKQVEYQKLQSEQLFHQLHVKCPYKLTLSGWGCRTVVLKEYSYDLINCIKPTVAMEPGEIHKKDKIFYKFSISSRSRLFEQDKSTSVDIFASEQLKLGLVNQNIYYSYEGSYQFILIKYLTKRRLMKLKILTNSCLARENYKVRNSI